MHLLGGPSTSETYIQALGFQVRNRVKAGLKSLDFPKEQFIPAEIYDFCGVGNDLRNKRGRRGNPRGRISNLLQRSRSERILNAFQ